MYLFDTCICIRKVITPDEAFVGKFLVLVLSAIHVQPLHALKLSFICIVSKQTGLLTIHSNEPLQHHQPLPHVMPALPQNNRLEGLLVFHSSREGHSKIVSCETAIFRGHVPSSHTNTN